MAWYQHLRCPASYFLTYASVKEKLSKPQEGNAKSEAPDMKAVIIAGGCAGIGMWTVAIPPDVVKSRLQSAPAGTYKGFADCARSIVRTNGVTGLFKGFAPAMARAFPANAAAFVSLPEI